MLVPYILLKNSKFEKSEANLPVGESMASKVTCPVHWMDPRVPCFISKFRADFYSSCEYIFFKYLSQLEWLFGMCIFV